MKHTHRWRATSDPEVDRCTVKGCGRRRRDDCKGGDLIWKPRREYEPTECQECGHSTRGQWVDRAEPDIHAYADRVCTRCGEKRANWAELIDRIYSAPGFFDAAQRMTAKMFCDEGQEFAPGEPRTFKVKLNVSDQLLGHS